MSVVDSTSDGSIDFDQDMSAVGDDRTVPKESNDFQGEVTGIAETVDAALSEIVDRVE